MQKKNFFILLFLFAAFLLLPGCGRDRTAPDEGRQSGETADSAPESGSGEEQLYLITGLNTEQRKITLKSCDSQEEQEYTYSGATDVRNKYGSSTTMSRLSPGELVKARLDNGTATSIQVSDEAFTYDNIHNFTLDTETKTVTVGKNTYYYGEDIQVFYNGNKISTAEISEWDTICLKGIEKKIYAIQVTNGHGTIVLQNTDLFTGGNITIGNLLSLDIEADMRIEVSEGTYLLSVANDGYGGSTEVTVEANRETTVDLNGLKGEGPKYGTITFVTVPENASVYLNGSAVDLSQPLSLKYGRYRLSAKADGYVEWDKTLVVNSESAVITIELESEEEVQEEEAQGEETEKDAAREDSGEEETNTQTEGEELTEAVKDLVDYLTTSGSGTTTTGSGSSAGTSNGAGSTAGGSAGGSAGSQAGSLAGSH